MGDINIFIKINEDKDKDIAKLVFFIKNRKKAEAFKKAFLLASQNEEFINEFVNPIFKDEFKKIVGKMFKDKLGQAQPKEEIKTDNKLNEKPDEFENDEF